MKYFFVLYLVFSIESLLITTSNINTREYDIIGGNETTIRKHPYQVSIFGYDEFQCSGAIVSDQWILTLGTCVSGFRYALDSLKIRAGSNHITNGGIIFNVTHCIIHPQIKILYNDYDIALLKTDKKITFTKTMKKISVAKKPLVPKQKLIVSGWGVNSSTAVTSFSDQLDEISAVVIQTTVCQENYTLTNITPRMFCANTTAYGPCWNDVGDTAVAHNKLYGLLSFNNGCFQNQYPSVYTNLPALRPWINYHING